VSGSARAQWRGDARAPRGTAVRSAAAGQAQAGEDSAPAGSARWSEALSDLLPQFSGWRTPSAAPAERDASAAPAGPGLPKVRTESGCCRPGCASRAAAPAGACSFARGRAARARKIGAQVALMFLTRGIIPYEDTWRQFLAAVPERVPGGSAAGWRALFSVYVHLPPDLAYPEGSLFAGHEIAGRIAVEWGQWSVVRAPRPARLLLPRTPQTPLHASFAHKVCPQPQQPPAASAPARAGQVLI